MEHALALLQVTLLEHLLDTYSKAELQVTQLGQYSGAEHCGLDWIVNPGTFGSKGLNSRDQLLSKRRKDWSWD